jgi:D-glycero-alpha-D-manno-heptose 1-phosphate guanylyltransferase
MEAIVLAGGLGTRLAAKLSGIPKPMAPVAGRPFLEILLNRLKRAGCTRALLSVGHLHATIQDHFGASFHGMRLDYVIENVPLGTGGALRKALPQAAKENVLVLNGDTFLDADFTAMMRFHKAEGAGLTIAITRRADVARYGGVLVKERRIVGFDEKGRSGPGWINAGAYILPKEMQWPQTLPERFSFEVDFLAAEIGRLAPAAYEVDGVFLDIGVPEDLDRAQRELAGFGI